jgi:hypothetical protein
LIDALEQDVREHGMPKLEGNRPPLLGFDQYTAGLLVIANQLVALRMEQSGGGKLNMLDGPMFPLEVVRERLRKFAKGKRDKGIDAAYKTWASNHPEVKLA